MGRKEIKNELHRRSLRTVLTAIFYLLFLCACASSGLGQNSVGIPGPGADLPLRAKIAQMLLVGFRGAELSEDNHIYGDIRERGIGGVLLFDYEMPSRSRPRNIVSGEQLARLCGSLQNISGIPLFIAIDQEGGRVNRLRGIPQFAESKTARELGEGNGEETRREAEETARFLAGAGINLNFAPCVDLDINPQNPIIGAYGRSFSADPALVIKHAEIWIDAHSQRGILSCIKHFPGHGSSTGDTHRGAVDVSDTWRREELIPYRELLNANPSLWVMTSHVFNAGLDPENPATLSKKILTGILREELGFKGIIVSDDFNMAAITANFSPETALERAINAGVDIICISNNGSSYDPLLAKRTIDTITDLVERGRIQNERIDESFKRIMAVKANFSGKL
jgi:beta-N-acetylhexosaminidase